MSNCWFFLIKTLRFSVHTHLLIYRLVDRMKTLLMLLVDLLSQAKNRAIHRYHPRCQNVIATINVWTNKWKSPLKKFYCHLAECSTLRAAQKKVLCDVLRADVKGLLYFSNSSLQLMDNLCRRALVICTAHVSSLTPVSEDNCDTWLTFVPRRVCRRDSIATPCSPLCSLLLLSKRLCRVSQCGDLWSSVSFSSEGQSSARHFTCWRKRLIDRAIAREMSLAAIASPPCHGKLHKWERTKLKPPREGRETGIGADWGAMGRLSRWGSPGKDGVIISANRWPLVAVIMRTPWPIEGLHNKYNIDRSITTRFKQFYPELTIVSTIFERARKNLLNGLFFLLLQKKHHVYKHMWTSL